MHEFNCHKTTESLRLGRGSWGLEIPGRNSYDRLQKDEKLNRPLSHPFTLSLRLLNCESSALTTMPVLLHR